MNNKFNKKKKKILLEKQIEDIEWRKLVTEKQNEREIKKDGEG